MLAAAAGWLTVTQAVPTAAPGPPAAFTVIVNGGARAVRCQAIVELKGSAIHGVFGLEAMSATPGALQIDTSWQGKVFDQLKAFIYCPGFGMTLLDVPSVSAVPKRTATIAPKPVSWTRVTGRVTFPAGEPAPQNLDIEVTHWADWIVEHYGTWDGAVPQFRNMATARLAADRSFVVDLPNLSRDPFVGRFRTRGGFAFVGHSRDAGTRATRYQLEPDDPPVEVRLPPNGTVKEDGTVSVGVVGLPTRQLTVNARKPTGLDVPDQREMAVVLHAVRR